MKVAEIWRYPIKSMGGERLACAVLDTLGIAGDRAVHSEDAHGRFDPFALSLPSHVPFHTAKGFTLSMAKQVWNGKMDDVIKANGMSGWPEQTRTVLHSAEGSGSGWEFRK
jgi:hypothetical protein